MKTTTRLGLRAALAASTVLGTALVVAAPASAQESQASLRGTITAAPGNPVTSISAVEVRTGIRRTTTVDAEGRYNFASLRPGVYRLEITQQQGSRNSDEFQLSVSQSAGLDIDLTAPVAPTDTATDAADTTGTGTTTADAPASGSGDIIVSGNRLRSLEGGEVGKVITQRLIEQLPQNNRNFLAFADLAPGVQFVQGANGDSRIQGGAQDSRTVNIFIDGVGQKDYVLKNGITGQDSSQGNPFPQLAVGEYRVLSSNYKAEFDQVSSVAITAITKSGTNQFHGEGFIDYTDQSLRAARPIELFGPIAGRFKVPTKDYQFGGALGGPIIRDIAHFFVTYEGKRQQVPVDIQPGNGTPISSLPSQFQGLFGSTNRTFNEDLYFAKIDVSPTDRDLIELSGKYRNETGQQLNSGIAAATTATNTDVVDKRATLRWEHTGSDWVNDLKLSYEDARWAPTPAVFADGALYQAAIRNGTTVTRFDLFRTGGSANFQDKGQKGYTVQDDATWTGLQGHTIKTGFKAKFVKLRSLQQNMLNPVYTYNLNLGGNADFNTTIPYRVQFGAAAGPAGLNSVIESDNFQYGVYIQDDWDVTDRLTVNLGLRWDYERTPAFLDFVHPQDARNAVSAANYPNLTRANYNINDYISNGNNRETFKGAFQPRIGFSYEFDDAGRFAVFGGFGRSYDRNQFDFLQQEISTGSFTTRTFNFITGDPLNTCTPSATCVPFNPIYLTAAGRAQLVASSAGGGRELRFINNDLKVPYSDQISLGLRGRFDLIELETGYSHVESKDGFAYLLGNRRADGSFFFDNPAIATDVPDSPFGFAPAGFGSIIIGDNGLETSADSAYLKFTKRYTQASPWSLDATYTFTEAEENRQFGETFSLDYASLADYPTLRSAGVSRHRLVTAGSVDTPIGITLSARLTLESPVYQKAFINTAVPFQRTIVGAFREPNGDKWGRRQIDLAATKYVPLGFITDQTRLRFRVDIINLFNDRNYVDFNNNPADNTRTATSPSIYRESTRFIDPVTGVGSGFGIGGNPPRTIKLSAGFSF